MLTMDDYKKLLSQKTIDELTHELEQVQMQLDMLMTVNNSLDGADITEGGGEPADQARYQTLNEQQIAITAEINKSHLLEQLQ